MLLFNESATAGGVDRRQFGRLRAGANAVEDRPRRIETGTAVLDRRCVVWQRTGAAVAAVAGASAAAGATAAAAAAAAAAGSRTKNVQQNC